MAGANVETESSDKSRPLHLAAAAIDPSVALIALLVEKGNAIINCRNVRSKE
jgi:hypothetical protein